MAGEWGQGNSLVEHSFAPIPLPHSGHEAAGRDLEAV